MYRGQTDLLQVVWLQMPRGIADKIKLDVKADAYFVRASVKVTLPNNQEYVADLEPQELEGVVTCSKVPAAFIANLCVLV